MPTPEPWYSPKPGARSLGLAALAVILVCTIGFVAAILYPSLSYPANQIVHSTLMGWGALVFVGASGLALVLLLLWYRPRPSVCPVGLAALTLSLVSAVDYAATWPGLLSPEVFGD